MSEGIQYLEKKDVQDDLISKNKVFYDMFRNNINQSEQLNELGIDDQISLFFKNISKSNNMVEFINNFIGSYQDMANYIITKEKDNIIKILEEFVLETLKSKKHLIDKVYKSNVQELKYRVLIKNHTIEKTFEIVEEIQNFNFSYIGNKFRISLFVYDINDFTSEELQEYRIINI